MKKAKWYLSGSSFAIAQKCPASLTIEFSNKLMADDREAEEGTDWHARIEADLEQVRRFLPEKDTVHEITEQRFTLAQGPFQLSGGVDYHAIEKTAPGKLFVVDWKTGPAGIDHLSAAQIEFYTYLILKSKKFPRSIPVELSLVSPRLNQQKHFNRTAQEILDDVDGKLGEIEKAIKRGDKPAPGEHCRYCNKRYICPQLRAELKRFADPAIFGIDGVRKEALQKITAEDLKTLSIAAAAIQDIRKYVSEMIANGQEIPGCRVEYQNAARIFAEGVDAPMIAKKLGVRVSQIVEEKLKTPSQLEKAGFVLDRVQDFIQTTTRKTLKVEAGKKQTNTAEKPQKPLAKEKKANGKK